MYNIRFFALLQFFLIWNLSSNFVDTKLLCFTSCVDQQLCCNFITTWEFIPFQLSNSHHSNKNTRHKYWWYSCMYFNLPNILNPINIKQLTDVISSTNTKCHGNLHAGLYKVSSRLDSLLKLCLYMIYFFLVRVHFLSDNPSFSSWNVF